jgi:Cof subfamily protein (haloacid dehalogenase superfamily)
MMLISFKGIGMIALDIDGTVTGADHKMVPQVDEYLHQLAEKGWQIIFLTGRTFSYGFEALKECTFAFYYSAYNGAETFHMPEKEMVRKHHLSASFLKDLLPLCALYQTDPLIHVGVERADACFYRPKFFDEEMLAYLAQRKSRSPEPWIAVDQFEEAAFTDFAYAKIFGSYATLTAITSELQKEEAVATSLIADPLRKEGAVLLINHWEATKGGALRDLRSLLPQGAVAIAAGDDMNDRSMLEEADVGIAMATAPKELRQIADITAPSAQEGGIIQGLREAIAKLT